MGCYSSACALVPCVAPCYDNTGTVVSCDDPSVVTDSAGNNGSQGDAAVSCAGAQAAVDTGVSPSIAAATGSVASANSGNAAPGLGGGGNPTSSISSLVTALATVGTTAYAASQQPTAARPVSAATGASLFSGTGGIVLIIAAVLIAFLVFGGKKDALTA
jgi:hypothetical protein